jgi:hypothetical protein
MLMGGGGSFSAGGPGKGMYTRYRTNYPLIVMIPGLYRLLRAQHAHGWRQVILRRWPRQGHVYQVLYQLSLDSYDTRTLSPSACSTCSWGRWVILSRRPWQGHVYQVPYQLCLDSYDTRTLSPSACSSCSWGRSVILSRRPWQGNVSTPLIPGIIFRRYTNSI